MKEINLSDGRKATIQQGKGKDLFWAQRNASDPSDIIKLLMVRLVKIDGEQVTEDILDDLPIGDVMLLIREFSDSYSPLLVEKQSSA
ncbi:hypothetical protein [Calditerrivibrio nitroreducens]|uniref:Uncharacterized protein n=1 Tax=Calditerrivibrio nitroreducens (strain DSM 19672 / NBRC 101217 / Yu37-1) TaxID=768670 RepID=E4TH26_CALNY|nr:hypothetical protein [Calditerrivibrio nitroreducens]ADR19824.1 hypothetical protein Calni_1922 [Calditerrivibrio nitroreducens DSM 19672]